MMNYNFTAEEKNEALSFAYSMGLARPEREEETCSALDFARSMGLRNESERKPLWKHNNRNGMIVAQPRFI